ncbi:M48 family metallopeptidase [Candidatus Poriferisodalis sp.]|uniref:M48 family metallopeptidase n=1 Tax=Candidatus Poriferisodalis sp. TaxID=3101277 RepID=UPI003C705D74
MDPSEHDWIRFGDAVIDYEIRRSARRHKTLEITAGPNGVRVAVPAATRPEDIAAFVRSKARWILDRLANVPAEQAPPQLPGTLPYHGRSLSLTVGSDDIVDVDVRFRPWELQVLLPVDVDPADAAPQIRSAVAEWYWLRACEHVSIGVDRWWPEMGGGSKPEVLIGDQRRRWGSCAADGQLRFNWRLVMLEPRLLDYVVVHELAHLTELNHGPDFWALVSSVLPDVNERKAALRAIAGTLPL